MTHTKSGTVKRIKNSDKIEASNAVSFVSGFDGLQVALYTKPEDVIRTHRSTLVNFVRLDTARAPASVAGARAYMTSIKIFKRHVFPPKRGDDCADGIISRECYEDWLSTRSCVPAEPERTFQRILTCTVTGTDGRQSFTPEEEATVLPQLRVNRVWPAFVDTGLSIGAKGFRG